MFSELNFRYSPEQNEQIQKLREIIENDHHLAIGTEDVLLSKFLYPTNWNVQLAYNHIQRYYKFKYDHPDWVACHRVQHYRDHYFNIKSKFVMPKADQYGWVIFVSKMIDAFDKYPNYFHDMIEMDDLLFESMLLLPKVQQNGITIIQDMSGATKNFIPILTPATARTINEKNEVLPYITRKVHVIQDGFLMNMASNLILPFMSKKMKEHIFTHNGKKLYKLHEALGFENVPAEYGGPKENVLDVNHFYSHMLNNADYLLKLQSYKWKK